ncbi:MAG: aspartate aminotransferase family protein, partial [Planctomycetes bacterium]|nr:aspartate aminotransferase family protein [Planctomycetota bacterium]
MNSPTQVERELGIGAYGSRGISIVRGHGATVEDVNGRTYVDATAMYGVVSVGHGNPEVAAAVARQAESLIACFGSFANPVRAGLMTQLTGLLEPLNRVFLCNSGTEAVECALKVARVGTGRPGIVAATGGFHGRTFGALSATFRPDHRRPFEPLLPGVAHVPFNDLAALDDAIDDRVGAVLLESIQGEGGVRVADGGFLQAAERLCGERGALLILDEVQTGFGRTGNWFGFQDAGIQPDVVCLAKGIANGVPMGAVALGPRVPPLKPG